MLRALKGYARVGRRDAEGTEGMWLLELWRASCWPAGACSCP